VHSPKGVTVRSYRDVVDVVERRIFRVDRWRLPTPHGVSVRALAYAAGCFAVILAAGALPLVGALLNLAPASLRYLAMPALGGWALASLAIDGRPPHHALASAARYGAGARTLAGLRPTAPVGASVGPVAGLQTAPSGDESRYRTGRVRGPATITLRYPAQVELIGQRRSVASGDCASLGEATRIRVRGLHGRPLIRGSQIRVPEGAEVVFE
jgi:hypothetical protein